MLITCAVICLALVCPRVPYTVHDKVSTRECARREAACLQRNGPMNTTSKGDALELSVYGYFENLIRAEQFPFRSSCCKIFRKKGYYSRDRGSDIVFDVSIEIYLPGAPDYSEVWLIECKNYAHSVPVNDVEEFFAKVQQVSPTGAKPVMVSNAAFQLGARNFAQAKKMGILRYLTASDVKWELYRSPSASAPTPSEDTGEGILRGLCSQEFRGAPFDLYMQSPAGLTNSLWDFTEGMLSASQFTAGQLHSMMNPRAHQACQVPFIKQAELEERSMDILRDVGYRGGPVAPGRNEIGKLRQQERFHIVQI